MTDKYVLVPFSGSVINAGGATLPGTLTVAENPPGPTFPMQGRELRAYPNRLCFAGILWDKVLCHRSLIHA